MMEVLPTRRRSYLSRPSLMNRDMVTTACRRPRRKRDRRNSGTCTVYRSRGRAPDSNDAIHDWKTSWRRWILTIPYPPRLMICAIEETDVTARMPDRSTGWTAKPDPGTSPRGGRRAADEPYLDALRDEAGQEVTEKFFAAPLPGRY